MFRSTDVNKDGVLTKREIVFMLDKLQIPGDNKSIDLLFDKFDRNKNGVLDFEEFLTALLHERYNSTTF